jgi:hypothetical protein
MTPLPVVNPPLVIGSDRRGGDGIGSGETARHVACRGQCIDCVDGPEPIWSGVVDIARISGRTKAGP